MQKIILILLIFVTLIISGCADLPNGKSTQERAIEAGDISICNTASHPDVCKMAFEQSLANNQTEEINCADFSGNKKDSCLSEKALKEQKATVCNEINDSISRNSCYSKVANAKGEWQVCERIDNSTRQNECMAGIAKQKKDASICEHATIYNADYLLSDCIIDTAKETCDYATCINMQEEYHKNLCNNTIKLHCN